MSIPRRFLGLEPTYKELKLEKQKEKLLAKLRLEPTYKELKLFPYKQRS
ncbi:MAG: hypothetical protein CH6_1059 [Candidatus Kapaibacterium sp.]|nr:MAG: hypothetical protein CH6_1059 [Candidatus Kapabacteria bacterium]